MDAETLTAWLVARLAVLTGVDTTEVDPDRPLGELGVASRDAVALSGELEDLLGRRLSPTLLWECPTLRVMAQRLVSAPEAPRSAGRPSETVDDGVWQTSPTRWSEPVAVVGLGCRFPGGADGPEAFWRLLIEGRDVIGTVPPERWELFDDGTRGVRKLLAATTRAGGYVEDIAGFDAAFFGIADVEAQAMDPQQRMVLEVAWEALEHAGIPPSSLQGSATGVWVGISTSEYGYLAAAELTRVEPWTAAGAALSVAANRLSYLLDLRGPSVAVDTACSSSLVAVHQACQSLRLHEADTAIVAGVNAILSPAITVSFDRAGALAPDGRSKAFAATADGMGRGEGCGVVILRRLSDAERDGDRILAVLRGSAVNSDGRSNGLSAPNPAAQEAVLRAAYAAAGVPPRSVDYVEAHGTGTPLGDPIEANALAAVLGPGRSSGEPLLLGSAKTNIGHLESAAGMAGLIKSVLALVHDRLPPSLHFTEPNPYIPFDTAQVRVVTAATAWPRYSGRARAGVSAFGFGGTNAHVVLEEWRAPEAPSVQDAAIVPSQAGREAPNSAVGEEPDGTPAADGPTADGASADGVSQPGTVLLVSGRSAERVRRLAGAVAAAVEGGTDPVDAAHTLARHRERGPVTAAVVARGGVDLAAGLRALSAGEAGAGIVAPAAARPGTRCLWLFSGYGSQWPGMGRGLLTAEPAFAAAVAELDPLFEAEAGFTLTDAITGQCDVSGLHQQQPVLFGMQVALARLWESHGVTPAAVVGQSMGEVAAAVVAGALSPADGVRVIVRRSALMATQVGHGGMAVVELTEDEVAEAAARFPSISVGVYTSPRQCVVGGEPDDVRGLIAHVEALGRFARDLKVAGAGHSAQADPILAPLARELTGLRSRPARIPHYTTVWDDPREPVRFDPMYWVANLRRPVRLLQALTAAAEDGFGTVIEVAPHPTATVAVEETLRAAGIAEPVVIPTLLRKRDESLTFRQHVATALVHGVPVDERRLIPVGRFRWLPTTPWEHRRFWAPDDYAGPIRRPAVVRGAPADDSPWEDASRVHPGARPEPAAGDGSTALLSRLRTCPPAEARDLITDQVRARIGAVLAVPADRVDADRPLTDLGLESLQAVRVRNAVEHDFGLVVPAALLLRGATARGVAEWIAAELAADAADGGAPGAAPPAPSVPAGAASGGRVEPRDAAERLVARVWAQVLGVEVGATDTLAGLGGGEAEAARILTELGARVGRDLAVPAPAGEVTPAAMAGLIRADVEGDPGAVLRTLRHPGALTGTRRPMFWFHPAGGPTSVYADLVRLLDADVPAYGLERLDDVDTIPAKAERYAELIAGVQPDGPYRLGGWSFGGFLAFETAQRLSAAGHPVELLALVDAVVPLPVPEGERRRLVLDRFRAFSDYLADTYGVRLELPYAELERLGEDEQIELVREVFTAADLGLPPDVVRHQYTSYVDLSIGERYRPRRWDGAAVLYRAEQRTGAHTVADPRYDRTDAEAGWTEYLGGLAVVPVTGHHLSVLDPPNVELIASDLTARLAVLDAPGRPAATVPQPARPPAPHQHTKESR